MSEETSLDMFADEEHVESPIEADAEETDHPQLGEVPPEWEIKELDEVADIVGGSTPSTNNEEYWDGDIPWATPTDITELEGNEISETAETLTEEGLNSTSTHVVPPGSVLMTSRATIGECAVNTVGMATNQGFKNLVPNDGIETWYLFYRMQERRPFLEALGSGSTFDEVSKTTVSSVEIPIPPVDEQRKIAAVLYTVDSIIDTTRETIEQINRLQTGVLQEVFSHGTQDHHEYQETTSGMYPAEWDVVRFEELITDTRYGTDTKSNTEGDGYPTLRIPNVVNKRLTLDDLKYTPISDDELDRLRLKEDDILVVRTNGNPEYVGQCITTPDFEEDYVYASYLIRLRVDEDRVLPAFIREFLNSARGRAEMSGWIRSSAGNYNLSVSSMEKFQVPVPSLEEQAEIVEKIESTEAAAQQNREYLDQVRRIKQGLMQDLMSGEIRTNDLDIDIPEEITSYEPT